MKELSIEEKAKAYDKALERAEKALEVFGTDKCEGARQIFSLFPELKESEDERIRKEIIATIHLYYGEPLEDEAKEMIAWLEKQGDKKPADKVEPKFKIGDWITNDYCAGKVIELTNDAYLLDTGQGIPFSCEHNVHLWTIQDAKDGDVLVSPSIKGQEGKEQIFIFKGINSRDYVDNCIEYYCRVYEGVFYENENGNGYMGTTSSPLYPATKEQRNLLFQKIKDAGYKWDEGKKELRKIEQKPQRMISAEAKEAMYDKPTDNDMQEALRTEYEKGRADVLRCIDPDEMVADFCSQTLSKTRSLASIYRQGIIDILKRINRNEETSITGTRSIDDGGVRPTTNCK